MIVLSYAHPALLFYSMPFPAGLSTPVFSCVFAASLPLPGGPFSLTEKDRHLYNNVY